TKRLRNPVRCQAGEPVMSRALLGAVEQDISRPRLSLVVLPGRQSPAWDRLGSVYGLCHAREGAHVPGGGETEDGGARRRWDPAKDWSDRIPPGSLKALFARRFVRARDWRRWREPRPSPYWQRRGSRKNWPASSGAKPGPWLRSLNSYVLGQSM